MTKALTILGALWCLLPAVLSEAGPRINFDAVEHDFGEVMHGESPSVELNVTNTGDAVPGSRKNRLVLRLCKRSARKQRYSSRGIEQNLRSNRYRGDVLGLAFQNHRSSFE